MKFLDQEKRRQLLNECHSCKMFDSHYEFSSEELEEIAEIARLSAKLLQHAAMAFCDGY
ncbi:hypothetical protein VN0636_08060 [Helicobacter pylori]